MEIKTRKKLRRMLDNSPLIGDIIDGYETINWIKSGPGENYPTGFWDRVAKRWFLPVSAAILIAGSYSLYNMQRYVSLRNEAEQIADVNHNGRLDDQELINFYNSVGMPFNIQTKTEVTLTRDRFSEEKLRDYIQNHRGK